MERLGSAHHQTPVQPLTMLVEIGCSTGRSLVAHPAKDQRLLQMTDISNSCNRLTVSDAACDAFDASLHRQFLPSRTASMAINSSTSLLRNSGRVRQTTQTYATRFLPIRVRPITGAHSRLATENPGTLRSQLNSAINSISSQPNGSEFGREMLEDTPHAHTRRGSSGRRIRRTKCVDDPAWCDPGLWTG
jgi:hypothetical protein